LSVNAVKQHLKQSQYFKV